MMLDEPLKRAEPTGLLLHARQGKMEDLLAPARVIRRSKGLQVIQERIFQHPVFARIVEMDESSLKFRPILRGISKSLYEKILRGGQKVRAREGQRNAAKAEELSRPENVYRMKVACNFLMELIDRERHSQDKDCVSWPLVPKRYENMVSGVDKQDEDLMNMISFLFKDVISSW